MITIGTGDLFYIESRKEVICSLLPETLSKGDKTIFQHCGGRRTQFRACATFLTPALVPLDDIYDNLWDRIFVYAGPVEPGVNFEWYQIPRTTPYTFTGHDQATHTLKGYVMYSWAYGHTSKNGVSRAVSALSFLAVSCLIIALNNAEKSHRGSFQILVFLLG